MLDYNNAIKLDSNYVEAYFNRGVLKKDLGDFRGAIQDYTKAIELNSKDTSVYILFNNRAYAKLQIGDFHGAIEDCNRAIELKPNYYRAYYARGAAKIELGDKDSGCKDLMKSYELGFDKALEHINKFCR